MMQLNNGAFSYMSNQQKKKLESKPKRVPFTIRLSLEAYDAILQLQRKHLAENEKTIPIWKVIDKAIKAYAKSQDIKVGE